jgi:RNA recognition motif-containing protein
MSKKIFVGNVPFHCSKEEFQEHFRHLDGFETADIIRRYKSNLSRGFGFIVFKNESYAKKILDLGEMQFKGRMLRFSPYIMEDDQTEKPQNQTKPIHRVYVSNIDPATSYQELKKCITMSGINVSTCFINTKNNRTTGIVFVDTLRDYTKLLETKIFLNGKPLVIKPYKKPSESAEKYTDAEIAYREGFKAGHIVGFQQGFQQGSTSKND